MHCFRCAYEKFNTRWNKKTLQSIERFFCSNGLRFLTAIKEFLLYDIVGFILLQFYLFYHVALFHSTLVLPFAALSLSLSARRKNVWDFRCCLQNKTLEPFKKLRKEVPFLLFILFPFTSPPQRRSTMHFYNKNSVKKVFNYLMETILLVVFSTNIEQRVDERV